MPSLKEVRNRIVSVSSTQQITKAMKMVAAAKLRRAQDKIVQMRPYSQQLSSILSNILSSAEEGVQNTFLQERPVEKVLIVVVTSDRGLCGAFNSNVIKATLGLIREKYEQQHKKGQLTLMCIGKKGRDFFAKRGYKTNETHTEILSGLSFDKVRQAAEEVMDAFKNGHYGAVEIVFNEFKNVATQIMRREQLLPIQLNAPKQESNTEEYKKAATQVDYAFEPSREEIIAELLPKTIKVQLYRAVLESNASEQGARMTAMDKATDNAKELLKELKLTYNRTRQAAITKEILEIVGGAEALSNG